MSNYLKMGLLIYIGYYLGKNSVIVPGNLSQTEQNLLSIYRANVAKAVPSQNG